jgi:hypothetical protein
MEDDAPDIQVRKGRPKGSKNKPKRGRPKKISETTSKAKKSKDTLRESKVLDSSSSKSEEDYSLLINRHLDDLKFTDAGYNTSTDKIINQEPVDSSYYYRGSKHVPVAGAQYEFTADMISELKKCKEDIIYFAENFFYIVSLDRGKEKIELYEAQKRVLRSFVAERNVIVCSSRQIGKALALDTPILTDSGWKTMGTISANDRVYGSDGNLIQITNVHEVLEKRRCYQITFDSGESLIADENHEWFAQTYDESLEKKLGSIVTTKQIFSTDLPTNYFTNGDQKCFYRIPKSNIGFEGVNAQLGIDPYILGLWLGNADTNPTWIYNKAVPEYQTAFLELSDKPKRIPSEYFLSSREQRLKLLTGLVDASSIIDSDGSVLVCVKDGLLQKDVLALTTELGYDADCSQHKIKGGTVLDVVKFYPKEQVSTINSKNKSIKLCNKDKDYHYITDIERCKSVPVRCITVDSPDSLYLAGKSLVPTHNSTMLTVFSLWMVCFHDDYRAAIVANKETTAINIFKRIRLAYEQLPNYIKPGVKDYGKTGMTLGNDSSIVVSTTTATSIRGDSLNCVLLDEAAHIETHLLEDFWSSVIPTVSSGKKSKILVVSTPKGVGNKFYEIYSGAESGKLKTWKSERIDWWDFPGRDDEWKQSQIELLGSEEKFLQEYNNTFLDDAANAVGAQVLERFKREKKPPIWSSDDGEYAVFEYPNPNKLYVVGVDVSEGIGRAASVAQILDVTDLKNIKQVAVFGSARIEPYHFANKLNIIGNSWGNPPMLIERNNCGAQVIDALFHKHQYEKIVSYSKVSEQDRYNRTRSMGVLSHNNIRFDGIQNMRYWINHLDAVSINDPNTISEFETFVKFPNGVFRKRSDNFFDDRVMALVWALFILESEICQQYFEVAEFDSQHKPLTIRNNGYWEIEKQSYELKDLSKDPKVIKKIVEQEEETRLSSYTDGREPTFFNIDEKYDEDFDSLLSQGYSLLDYEHSS